jgi:ribosomal protein L20
LNLKLQAKDVLIRSAAQQSKNGSKPQSAMQREEDKNDFRPSWLATIQLEFDNNLT